MCQDLIYNSLFIAIIFIIGFILLWKSIHILYCSKVLTDNVDDLENLVPRKRRRYYENI